MKKYLKNFNKKTKIIMIVVIIILSMGIGYYAYSKENTEFETSNFEIENQNEIESEEINPKNQNEKIKIHISGAVKNEGVIELEENSRVADAIEKSGGFTEEAYTKEINLASKLEDGTKIYIPTKKEIEEQSKLDNNGQTSEKSKIQSNTKSIMQVQSNGSTLNTDTQSSTNSAKNSSKININTATTEQLDTLPGIGASTADKIIQYRKEKGKFKTKEDIKNVSGIGESKFNKIKDLIEV